MKRLTLEEAASALGKSVRQVRYLIREGRLTAEKVGGRWYVDATQLELPGGQARAADADAAAAEKAAEKKPRKVYSVQDLRVFQRGAPLFGRVRAALGVDHPATHNLRASLDALACGCHAFEPSKKAAHFEQARERVATAVMDLLLDPSETRAELALELERDVLPSLAGLIRQAESRRRRAPFAAFGSFRG